ncbi:hypothetical protein ACN47E_005239 [Coniothyrium glycines]
MRNTPAHDPWHWTPDDLVNALCHSIALFQAAGCAVNDFPSPAALEQQIRTQEITGSTFLTALNMHSPRAELDINHLGQRMALDAVIQLLRARSDSYQQHIARTGVDSLSLTDLDRPTVAERRCSLNTETDSRKKQKRAHLATQPLPSIHHGSAVSASTGAWDCLLQWQQVTDDSYADCASDDGDIDEDEDESITSEAAAEEIEEEPLDEYKEVATERLSTRLSPDQVLEIINERIEFYTNSWRPGKDTETDGSVDYDPKTMWDTAQAAGNREELVRKHATDRSYFSQRLDKLCEEIWRFPANTLEGVKLQCRNLEITVHSMELAEWLMAIYQLEAESDEDSNSDALATDLSMDQPVNHSKEPRGSEKGFCKIVDLGSPPSSSDETEGHSEKDKSPLKFTALSHRRSPHSNVRILPSESDVVDTLEVTVSVEPRSATPVHMHQATISASLGDEPENASITTVRRWKWEELLGTSDRKRVVSKIVHELTAPDREAVRGRLKHVTKSNIIREIHANINTRHLGRTKMQGILPKDQLKIETLANLFISWWFCINMMQQSPTHGQMGELQACLEREPQDLDIFYDYLSTIMTTTFGEEALRNPNRPSQAEIIEISDDEHDAQPAKMTQDSCPSQPHSLLQDDNVIVLD